MQLIIVEHAYACRSVARDKIDSRKTGGGACIHPMRCKAYRESSHADTLHFGCSTFAVLYVAYSSCLPPCRICSVEPPRRRGWFGIFPASCRRRRRRRVGGCPSFNFLRAPRRVTCSLYCIRVRRYVSILCEMFVNLRKMNASVHVIYERDYSRGAEGKYNFCLSSKHRESPPRCIIFDFCLSWRGPTLRMAIQS